MYLSQGLVYTEVQSTATFALFSTGLGTKYRPIRPKFAAVRFSDLAKVGLLWVPYAKYNCRARSLKYTELHAC